MSKAETNGRKFASAEHFGNNQRKLDIFGWTLRNDRNKLVAKNDKDLALHNPSTAPLE